MALPKLCSVKVCGKRRAVGRRGYCNAHYIRWYRRGDALAPRLRAEDGALELWLLAHVRHSADECLIWPFARTKDGVGRLGSKICVGSMSTAQAPRAMCALAHGEPPFPDAQAAHNCGKGHTGCVNPLHLRWASPKENTWDKKRHGTQSRGEAHPPAKLTALQVKAMRELHPTFTIEDLAEIFSVHAWTIRDAVERKTWAWLV